jgi:OOP family OmpA-OmpF porin
VPVCRITTARCSRSTSTTETGWKTFGGYLFNDHFGAEAAWVDPGDANDNGATLETHGIVLQRVGRLRMGVRFALMGKVGAFFWEQSARHGSFREDRNGTDLARAIGGSYGFCENRLRVRLEWEEYDSDIDVAMLPLGIAYHFR